MVAPNSHLSDPSLALLGHVSCSGCNDAKSTIGTFEEPIDFIIREDPVGVALLVGHGSKNGSVSHHVSCSGELKRFLRMSHWNRPSIL